MQEIENVRLCDVIMVHGLMTFTWFLWYCSICCCLCAPIFLMGQNRSSEHGAEAKAQPIACFQSSCLVSCLVSCLIRFSIPWKGNVYISIYFCQFPCLICHPPFTFGSTNQQPFAKWLTPQLEETWQWC